jgi:hypothetical protein
MPQNDQPGLRPNTTTSVSASSDTHVQHIDKSTAKPQADYSPPPTGQNESVLPGIKAGETIDSLEDWETDPANARNWQFGKKWTTVSIVGLIAHSIKFSCSLHD